ncbi:MAG: hypothetical protein MUF71_04410 [Candidatus Kapabacteria bacterium]|jgi:hypothetical protein|nr:hypothetical protein [Candidatus Kapabacteria bacterium]
MSNQEDFKDLQQLWQKSTQTESLNLQHETMMQRIKTDVAAFDKKAHLTTWIYPLMYIAVAIGSVVVVIKAIQKVDVFTMGMRAASMVLYGSEGLFNAWLMWKMRAMNFTSHREYLEGQIQKLTWYLNYNERYGAPIAMVSASLFVLSFWDSLEWWAMALIMLVLLLIFGSASSSRESFNDARNLRSRLTSALRQLNEE